MPWLKLPSGDILPEGMVKGHVGQTQRLFGVPLHHPAGGPLPRWGRNPLHPLSAPHS